MLSSEHVADLRVKVNLYIVNQMFLNVLRRLILRASFSPQNFHVRAF